METKTKLKVGDIISPLPNRKTSNGFVLKYMEEAIIISDNYWEIKITVIKGYYLGRTFWVFRNAFKLKDKSIKCYEIY